jgi:ribonuclease HII
MAKDADKVFSARKKSFGGLSIRYIACAGIFLKDDEDKIMDYAEESLSKYGIDSDDGFFIEPIDKHHMLLIF